MNDMLKNTLPVGTVLNDKWVVLEFIAKGGMGELYRAHQLNLKRDVAIKVISREWLESLGEDEEELLTGLQRFRNEVQAMAQIRHPNILQIYDHGSTSIGNGEKLLPVEYIAMEYIPGGTPRSTMSEEGFYPEEELTRDWLMQYFLPVLDGVEALHEADIVHRDIKPGNVLMDGEIPKIADFGLARSGMSKPVTRSADIKGTPAYMPIEQFLDFRRTDERTDIYALGKVLYEAIDGKMKPNMLPFKKAALKNTNTPFFKELDAIIQKATAEDKNERQSTIDELRNEVLQAIYTLAKTESNGPVLEAVEKKVHFGLPSSSRKWVLLAVAFLAVSILFVVSRQGNIAEWLGFNPLHLKAPQATDRLPAGSGTAATPQNKTGDEDMEQMMDSMHQGSQTSPSLPARASPARIPAPVILFKPDTFGIRGLNGELSEWGTEASEHSGTSGSAETKYVILGGPLNGRGEGGVPSAPLVRNPWEAFAQVGFRCVLSALPLPG